MAQYAQSPQIIQMRRGTASYWNEISSFIPLNGEPIFETDTGKLKVGDGISTWGQLKYINDATLMVDNTISGSKIIDNTITTDKILNGTIVDADISPNASINNSKLNTSGVTAGQYTSPIITVNDRGIITNAQAGIAIPTGVIQQFGGLTAPSGYLLCDGSSFSQSSFSQLYAVIGTRYNLSGDVAGSFRVPDLRGRVPVGYSAPTSLGAVTMATGTPGVFTKTSHGLVDGQIVYFTTTGALLSGITVSTRYYVEDATANTFTLATTIGGSRITLSGTQSGTHTLWSSDFDLGVSGGELSHTLSVNEMPIHTHIQNPHTHIQNQHRHTVPNVVNPASGSSRYFESWSGGTDTSRTHYTDYETATNQDTTATNQNTGGSYAHLNMQPYVATSYIIKT